MTKVYAPADAQRDFLDLLRQVSSGKSVKIEAPQQAGNGAILVSESQWTAMQQQLQQANQTHEIQDREDLYKAWRWL
ncbi:hypothetical protein [Levilactobacillus cerevisiae]|uniref:hypothetical protein n=1 Tax=Levilactobacillus cerevisiae TaxID=1704076 RepID=UPI000F76FE85|nr:hypothetical protein [Levilactobacillus cerevisiae]